MLYVLWAFSGWCGTPWPGWWRGPHPHPDPDPWLIRVVAIVGGILGGLAVGRFAPTGTVPDGAPAFVATMIGAFVTGRVFSDIAIIIVGGRSATQDAGAAGRAGP
jgi:hypothetical protein